MKKNIDWVTLAGVAGSMLTVAASLLTSYSNDKKMDATIEKKVAEELAKQLASKNE